MHTLLVRLKQVKNRHDVIFWAFKEPPKVIIYTTKRGFTAVKGPYGTKYTRNLVLAAKWEKAAIVERNTPAIRRFYSMPRSLTDLVKSCRAGNINKSQLPLNDI